MGPLNGTRGQARRPRASGFTLVELLVVLVILGIAASLVAVNLGGDDRRDLEREAKRCAGALEHAAALAQWRSETLGVSAEGGGYRFWRRGDGDRWMVLADDDVLAAHPLPAGMRIAPATYAGAPVAANAILPLRASGRNEPYALTLDSAVGHVVIASDPLNRVRFAVASPDASGLAAVQ